MKTENSPVKVCVCVCPLTEDDLNNGVNEVVSVDNQEVKISLGTDKGIKSYEMDFEPFYFGNLQGVKKSSLKEACNCFGSIVIGNTFTGYNTSIFTYGSKSSGKSTIIFGLKNEKGLISTILEGLFEKASNYNEETSFRCEISFFEVCDDLITDLISKRSNVKSNEGSVKLKVREDPVKGPSIEKLSRHIVTDVGEAQNLFSRGLKSRNRMAALDPSSKKTSSTIFSITFITASLKDGLPMELISRTNIIDVASEDGYPKYTNGFNSDIFGENEAEDEKQGPLETLNEVINKLASYNINPIKSYTNISQCEQKIPYRDSNLTWLMKDALGGNSETIMICCLYPSEKNLRETLNTLKYGNLARHIQNKPQINEDQNVKLIRELKDEIEALKIDKNGGKKNLHKLQRDQELMNRLTGIWETKWSKAQQMIEDKSLDVKDLGGKGLKLETKEPHFVSLGGGRLSVGVSIIPIAKGFTRVGSGGDSEVDLLIRGKGIASVHCLIEYDGEVVVLHPKNVLVSVDGMPLSEPTRLPQGCMVCIGQNNYFRFNHPREATKIKEMYSNSRFSIVPDDIYPDVQLAIEQRKIEIQEKERLQTENKRLLALEQQYMESLDRLTLEKDQLEHEKKKLQILQQQQQTIANQLDVKMTIQIEELKVQKEELQSFHIKNEKIRAKEREIEMAAKKLEEEQNLKEQQMKIEREALLNQQATLDKLEELSTVKKSSSCLPIESLEDEKRRLALLELDILTEDLEYHDQFQKQKEEIQNQKQKLEEMENQHRYLIDSLTSEICRLQKERDAELEKIKKEKERLQVLEKDQSQALLTIEQERNKLIEARDKEKIKFDIEREQLERSEIKRLSNLQKTVEDQQRERDMIIREKMKLADLEDAHKRALDELKQDIISQQEKHDRERKLELEYIEAEQLMLEELEQKQFESVRQIEHETQIIRDQIDREKLEEQARLKATERYIAEIKKRQEITLRQAEEEREKVKRKREEEQVQLQHERDKLAQIELEYQEVSQKLREEQEQWRLQFVKEKEEIVKVQNEYEAQMAFPKSALNSLNHDIQNFQPDWMSRQIEEERLRLSELKRVATEKAETEWKEENKNIYFHEDIDRRKKGLETLKSEFKHKSEIQTMSILAEMEEIEKQETLLKQREQELKNLKIERERREELEKMLLNEKQNEMLLEKSLLEEKVRLTTLEKSFAEERSKRVEVERRLQEEEERNKNLSLDRKKLDIPSNTPMQENNGTLKRRLPSYTLSVRSGQLGNDQELNLLQYLTDAGHSIENSLDVRINRYSCRGYLLKMGHRFNISWKKRWFVFDRKLRALCYYQDEWKTKSKGILYFQSIQEVYVDNGVKRSPNPKTTFCIRTPQRTYVLNASTPIVMSIWIDVIITGREGGLMSMTL
ncbi:kinesin-like protein KIF16B isoform X2 [Hydra vulgaris]|uniref:Kinesin-like protein KIF16B isoform X2 n=1 Tax=Hydra vulgaris TaxID=6087 RepID=A0ABM4B624_HYDVU